MANQIKRKKQHRQQSKIGLWLLGIGGLLILAAALVAVLNNGQAAGTPRLAVDRETIDMGPVKLGQTVSASFTLTNTGDAPLRFSEQPYVEVKEGC